MGVERGGSMTIPRKHVLEHLEMHGFQDFIIIAIRSDVAHEDELYSGQIEVFSTLTDNAQNENIITQCSGEMKANWIIQSELFH
jgi:hypothetical protein